MLRIQIGTSSFASRCALLQMRIISIVSNLMDEDLFELADVAELLLPGWDETPTLLLALGVPTPQLGCLLHVSDADGEYFRNSLHCIRALIVAALNEPQDLSTHIPVARSARGARAFLGLELEHIARCFAAEDLAQARIDPMLRLPGQPTLSYNSGHACQLAGFRPGLLRRLT